MHDDTNIDMKEILSYIVIKLVSKVKELKTVGEVFGCIYGKNYLD